MLPGFGAGQLLQIAITLSDPPGGFECYGLLATVEGKRVLVLFSNCAVGDNASCHSSSHRACITRIFIAA
jgi:hypothetical protein